MPSLLEQKRFNTFGTARIFEKRVKKYALLIKLLNFLGLAIPITIGLIFLAIGSVDNFVKGCALLLGAAQALAFLWSIIDKWDDKHQYSIEALRRQDKLFTELNDLDQQDKNFQTLFDKLLEREKRYKQDDISKSISNKEIRYGTRKSLYRFQVLCQMCNETPQTEKPPKGKKCDNCPNF